MTKSMRGNYRRLLATSLVLGGALQVALPTLAQLPLNLTAGGTQINNTATGTYVDPNNPGVPITTQSNTVVVTVAEIAGVTVTNAGIKDPNGGTITNGDVLNYDFTVTNVGNDPTRIRIPNLASLTGPIIPANGVGPQPPFVQVSFDGGNTFVTVPVAAGELITPSVPAGSSFLVRVNVVVNGAVGGEELTVKLGQTPGNAQNQPRSADGGDVFTVDNPNGGAPGEVDGDPTNGVREASNTQTTTVGATTAPKAFATVLKTAAAVNNNSTALPTGLTDDVVTYNLSLRVEQTPPLGSNRTAAGLSGTPINVGVGVGGPFTATTRILVSDVIPAGTRLSFATDPGHQAPTALGGWTIVYSNSDPATTTALTANWYTTPPTSVVEAAAVRRIGYMFLADGTLPAGTTLQANAFTFSVVTTGAPPAGPFNVDNIAQLFGRTEGTLPSDPANPLVYDESGDQRPSNFRDDGTPGPNSDLTPTAFNTAPDSIRRGVPDPVNQGLDSGNNNTGTDGAAPGGGEVNRVPLIQPTAAPDLLNGPQNFPGAIGPTNNNDDFTNKAAPPTNTTPGTAANDPPPIGFTNTVQNTSTTPQNITLLPSPTLPNGGPNLDTLPNGNALPNGTTVTITFGGESRTYTWNDGGAGPGFWTPPAQPPIVIPNVPAGGQVSYGVEINLPAGTPLSTDSTLPGDPAANTSLRGGYPVPIIAYIDQGPAGLDPNDPQNVTIDRVYLGYVKLFKEAQILGPTGNVIQAYTSNAAQLTGLLIPGRLIDYRVTYTNISETGAPGNVNLAADRLTITESGIATCLPVPAGFALTPPAATITPGGNNWAQDNDNNAIIDTSNVPGQSFDSGPGSTITFFSGSTCNTPALDQQGNTQATDVTRYVNTLSIPVPPNTTRTFTFRRRIN